MTTELTAMLSAALTMAFERFAEAIQQAAPPAKRTAVLAQRIRNDLAHSEQSYWRTTWKDQFRGFRDDLAEHPDRYGPTETIRVFLAMLPAPDADDRQRLAFTLYVGGLAALAHVEDTSIGSRNARILRERADDQLVAAAMHDWAGSPCRHDFPSDVAVAQLLAAPSTRETAWTTRDCLARQITGVLKSSTGSGKTETWLAIAQAGDAEASPLPEPAAPAELIRGEPRNELATKLRISYEQGATIRALATETGRSYNQVRRLLLEAGTCLRSRTAEPHTVILCDIENDSRGGIRRDPSLQHGLHDILEDAAERAQLRRMDWVRQSTGDGELALLPADIPKYRVVSDFLDHLRVALGQYNRNKADRHRIRLRLAVDWGDVVVNGPNFAGSAPITIAQLSDCVEFKRALAESTTSDLALIVSDRFYDEAVRDGAPGVDSATYRKVLVEAHKTSFGEYGWIHVPHGSASRSNSALAAAARVADFSEDDPAPVSDKGTASAATTDAALVSAFRNGDHEAFSTLYERYSYPVERVLRRTIPDDPELLAEAVMETFLRALRSLDRLDNPEHFAAWLLRIGGHTAHDVMNRSFQVSQATGRRLSEWLQVLDGGPSFLPFEDRVARLQHEYGIARRNAEAIVHEHDRRRTRGSQPADQADTWSDHEAVSGQPADRAPLLPKEALVSVLAAQGMSASAIAATLGMPTSLVKIHLEVARRSLDAQTARTTGRRD